MCTVRIIYEKYTCSMLSIITSTKICNNAHVCVHYTYTVKGQLDVAVVQSFTSWVS